MPVARMRRSCHSNLTDAALTMILLCMAVRRDSLSYCLIASDFLAKTVVHYLTRLTYDAVKT